MSLPLAVTFDAITNLSFWISVGVIAGTYAVVAVGLQLNTGFTGIVNFGQAAFMAIGAYTMAILVLKAGFSFWLSLPCAVLVTMLAFRTSTPQNCGILELDDRRHVTVFHEKVADPPGNLANGAVYVFEDEVVDRIASLGRPVVDLSTEVIPALLPRIQAVEYGGFFLDIGTTEALAYARAHFPRFTTTNAARSDRT